MPIKRVSSLPSKTTKSKTAPAKTTRAKATTTSRVTTTSKSTMTVREAGRLGGQIGGRKGGLSTRDRHGHEFYEEIGHKGGKRVRELIAAGRRAMMTASGRKSRS